MIIDVSHITSTHAGRPRGGSTTLAALRAIGHPANTKQIAYAVGVLTGRTPPTVGNIASCMLSLIRTGQVEKVGKGLYSPVEADSSTPHHNPAPIHTPAPANILAAYAPNPEPVAVASPKRLPNSVVGTLMSFERPPGPPYGRLNATFDIGDGQLVVTPVDQVGARAIQGSAGFGFCKDTSSPSGYDFIGTKVKLHRVNGAWAIFNAFPMPRE